MAPGERSVVSTDDHARALALVTDWSERYVGPYGVSTAGQLELVGMIVAAIADGRNGAIPGERTQVDQVLDVHPERWRHGQESQDHARRTLREGWARALDGRGLRPLDWPPITVTFLRYAVAHVPTRDQPWAECEDEDQADLVRLSISGLAVPQ